MEDIEAGNACAVLNGTALRNFYLGADPAEVDDVEAAGSVAAKSAIVAEGMPALRPSMEAGFHSILDEFVLLAHPVYVNLAACSAQGGRSLRRRY